MFSFIQDRHAPGLKNSMTGLRCNPELVDSESAGLEESGATRIFNGFESLLIPGGQFYGIRYKSSLSTIKGKAGSNLFFLFFI